MKRMIALFLLLTMTMSLCACGGTTEPKGALQAEPTATLEPEENWEEAYNEAATLYYTQENSSAAFEAIKDAEEADYAPALRLLGTCYLNGAGTEKNEEKGIALLEKAAELGDVLALYLLGNAHYNGLGTERDLEKGREFYTQFMQNAENAAENDTPEQGEVLLGMGICYVKGLGVAFDMDKAQKVYQKAVETEKLSSIDLYTVAAGIENVDKKTAISLYREAFAGIEELAKNGDVLAQRYMGQYYYFGDGITAINYGKAFEWFSKAADQGNPAAKFYLANIMHWHTPSGIENDDQKVLELFLEAAELGNTSAMCQLGKLYEYGEIVDMDYAKAMEWYLKAAERESNAAMFDIGCLYYEGKGVEKDYVEAACWFLKAAELGNETAKKNLEITEIANALPEARKRLG